MSADIISSYKTMLLELSNMIDEGDLDRIKFRCDKIIKKAESQRIKDPLALFTALEQREHLGPGNTEFLKELLKTCCRGKVDGLRLVEQYEYGLTAGDVAPPPVNNIIPGSTNGVVGGQPQIVYVVQGNQNLPPVVPRECNRQRYLGPDLTPEISFLSTKLGKDWRFFVRELGLNEEEIDSVTEDCKTVKEKIWQSMYLWQQMEQQCACKQKMIDALRKRTVERYDLATKLEEGVFT